MMDSMIETLARCSLFSGKTHNELEDIRSRIGSRTKRYRKKDLIIRIDQASTDIGIIMEGCAEIQKPLLSGNVFCMYLKKRGEVFGGSVAFTHGSAVYPCDLYAIEDTTILFIPAGNIFDMIKGDALLCSNMLGLFAESVLKLQGKVDLLSCSSIKHKILAYLLNPQNGNQNGLVCLPFSKKTWAEYLNVSRPSLSRELKNLAEQDLIEIDGRIIRIKNEASLRIIFMQ